MPGTTQRPLPAVAAVIVENGKILLIKRSFAPSKGKWSVPGGHVEWGEPLVEALRREVREETGLEIEVDRIAGVFDLILGNEDGIVHHYVIIDYFARRTGGELSPGDDASEVMWAPLDELDNLDLTPNLLERLRRMGVLPLHDEKR